MKRTKPYAIRAIVENGRGEFSSLASIKLPYISERTECLAVRSFDDLNLVGRLDKQGIFRAVKYDKEKQISLSFYVTRLKPRVIIFEDGRVYYNDSLEEISGGGDLPALRYFLQSEFANKQFIHHFESLYKKLNGN